MKPKKPAKPPKTPNIEDVVADFFAARAAIFKHVGYVEDYRILPLVEYLDDFWSVDQTPRGDGCVKFSPSREGLEHWLKTEDFGKFADKLYSHNIYTQRFLPKWVYRGEKLTMIVVDTGVDMNQLLQLFRNENEVSLP